MHPYPMVGDKVGPYRIDGRLGGGEHGVVFSARQASSGARVALKVMSPDVAVGTGWTATAPEVHLGSEPGIASDIHSMGALLWETLTGQPVHHGTPFQVAEAYVKDPAPTLQGRSPQVRHLNQLLARAMHRDPARRHASALELRNDLLTALWLPGEVGPMLRAPYPSSRPSERTEVLTLCFALALMSFGLVASMAMLMMSF